jgi:transcriptional regulator with XRE-family HTH domain
MLSSSAVSPEQEGVDAAQVSAGERVQQERVRAGFTQQELADLAGCTRNTIANVEGNKTRSRRTIEAVAHALSTTPEALGYRFRSALRTRDLTSQQRDFVEEVLALSPEEQERVFEVVSEMRRRRKRGRAR